MCGTGEVGFASGKALTEVRFDCPGSICIDPIHPSNLYIGDYRSIRYYDAESQTVSLIAGGSVGGFRDGPGQTAQFEWVIGLLCTSHGDTLYACDSYSCRIRMVDTQTKAVSTIAGDGQDQSRDGVGLFSSINRPNKLVFDRSPTGKPQSVMFITSDDGMRRFDIETGALSTCSYRSPPDELSIQPSGIAALPTGRLIVCCSLFHSVYVYDPVSCTYELLAGPGAPFHAGRVDGTGETARFVAMSDLVVVEHERCVYVAANHQIRCVALPEHLFANH